MKRVLLMIAAFVSLTYSSEFDDPDQKKRGFTKSSSSNTAPTGAQKQEYTYSTYSQIPSSQNSPTSSQVPNSFYPSHAASQYYSSANSGSGNGQTYSTQPQISHGPSQISQYIPVNIAQNPGYQAKYQVVPSKAGSIQVAIVQPPYTFQAPSVLNYPHTLLSPNPTNNVSHRGSPHVNVLPNFQQLLGNSFLGHPSMLLFGQPNQLYNSPLYQSNPVPSFYYPSSNQAKYNVQLASPVQSDYDTVQSQQTIPKEDNEVASPNSDYSTSVDPSSSYKNTYSSRANYVKLT